MGRPFSPRSRARITGGVYLLFFLTAVLGAIVTPGTAKDIVAHESSFRLGHALTLVSTASYVAVGGLFYQLFKPVSRSIALLGVLFNVVGCAMTAIQRIFQLAPSVVSAGTQHSNALNAEQSQALAQMLLDLNAQAGYVALVFFGVFQLLIGYLIFRSTFLPRFLGALIAIAGVGWLTFLSPPFANQLDPLRSPPRHRNAAAARCATGGAGLEGPRRRGAMGQRGQSTLEWFITAAVVLGTLVVGIVAWNEGLVGKIHSMVQQMV